MVYSTESHSFEGVDYEDDGDKFPTAKWQSIDDHLINKVVA